MGTLLRFFLLDFVMDILLIICDWFLEFKEGAAWNLLTLWFGDEDQGNSVDVGDE